MNDKEFSALVVEELSSGIFQKKVKTRELNDLPPGDVVIEVVYSSLNYKDALSASGNRGITKKFPHTPGIDAAGHVLESSSSLFQKGDDVICMGYDLGMNTWGGFSQYIRVPSTWVHHKPRSLSLLQAMQIGTAGFTAAQCVEAIVTNSVSPTKGPILVTGATGGVGLISIMMLSQLGYKVHALTGKKTSHPLLTSVGADTILPREKGIEGSDKILLSEQWAGVVDTVGGQVLANSIKATMFDGVVTSCGNAMSADLPLTVYPFIFRGVHLVGIYSANCPMDKRLKIWQTLAGKYDLSILDQICTVISLDLLAKAIDAMLAGQASGRKVIRLQEGL